MSSWHTGDLTVGGLRLHYTRSAGAGTRPPIVLAHGVTDDGLCWKPVAEVLAADYDVIMVDARGHGESDAPAEGYGPAEQAGDLAGVIGGLGLERPVILGHSMGAITALALAGLHPGLPRAVLLEDPPVWWVAMQGTQNAAEWLAGMRVWLSRLKRMSRDELIAEQRAATPGWSDDELGPWADSKLRVSPDALSIFHPSVPASVDWPALLPRVSCPALLITADPALGAIVSAEHAAALREHVPQLQLAHIPQAGHSIHRDQFAAYMRAVRAFLDGLAP